MATKCYAQVRARVARFTLIDPCGSPGVSSIVTNGITAIRINERLDTVGADVRKDEVRETPRLRLMGREDTVGYEVDLDLCGVNPDLIAMLTKQAVVVNAAGDVVGNDATLRTPAPSFALEVWSKLSPAVDDYRYGYTVFPRLKGGRVSGFEFTNGAVNFKVAGARTLRHSKWGLGPYTNSGWDMVGWDLGGWDAEAPQGDWIGKNTHWRSSLSATAPTQADSVRA